MFLYTGTKAGCKKQIIIQEKISMKNVLLLGDSIRIGYDEFVQEALKDTAKVYYSDDNGRCTQYTLVSLMEIAALTGEPQKIDLIHWNNGHWDIAHYGKNAPSLNSKEQYAFMLEMVANRLHELFSNAKIVFATTTPMNPNGSPAVNPRTTEEIMLYNETAKQVMKNLQIPVNDLFSVMKDKSAAFYKDYCHYTQEGFRILGKQVADTIRNFL